MEQQICEKCQSTMENGMLTFCPDGRKGCEVLHYGFECKRCASEQLQKNKDKLDRENEIRTGVRELLILHLEDALNGSEAIFKEVWENTSLNDYDIVKDEILRIINILE